MRETANVGLTVWDLETDEFSHTALSSNWDLIDNLLVAPASSFEVVATLPSTGNFAGRIVMLSAANGGFAAYTLCRYDGTNWKPINQIEIFSAVPTQGNFAGRVVVLSANDSGFLAWSIILYNGTSWNLIGGWATVNNGSGATNIQGLQTTGDVYVSNSGRGFVLTDRTTGSFYRLCVINGSLAIEDVT